MISAKLPANLNTSISHANIILRFTLLFGAILFTGKIYHHRKGLIWQFHGHYDEHLKIIDDLLCGSLRKT